MKRKVKVISFLGYHPHINHAGVCYAALKTADHFSPRRTTDRWEWFSLSVGHGRCAKIFAIAKGGRCSRSMLMNCKKNIPPDCMHICSGRRCCRARRLSRRYGDCITQTANPADRFLHDQMRHDHIFLKHAPFGKSGF